MAATDLKNRHVRFRVCDVYFPDAEEVLRELHADDVIEGTVVDLSDGGSEKNRYVVVRVDGLKRMPIVAVDRLLGIA